MIPSLQSDLISTLDDQDVVNALQRLQLTQKHIWPRLNAIYESIAPPKPYSFQPGNCVFIHRPQHKTLELRWKGSFMILMTTPTAIKVYGIAMCVHYSHTRPADSFVVLEDYKGEILGAVQTSDKSAQAVPSSKMPSFFLTHLFLYLLLLTVAAGTNPMSIRT